MTANTHKLLMMVQHCDSVYVNIIQFVIGIHLASNFIALMPEY